MSFLVFEGLDGSGKTSLIQMLSQKLKDQGLIVKVTREPGGTPLAEDIRNLLLRTGAEAPVPRAELLLYEASRAQHVDQVIQPALKRGEWVLCDRFTSSTLAFQNGGRGLDRNPIAWLNQFATDGLEPDLWVLLDLSVEESERRLQARVDVKGSPRDRFEAEARSFHERVRKNYHDQAKANPEKWIVLNSQFSPSEVFEGLLKCLRERKWLV